MRRISQLQLLQQLIRTDRGSTRAASQLRHKSAMPDLAGAEEPVNSKDGKVMHPELLNENMLKTQYAVRGELYLKAEELRQQGHEITFTNGSYMRTRHTAPTHTYHQCLTSCCFCSRQPPRPRREAHHLHSSGP
jgi:hypothetical protein